MLRLTNVYGPRAQMKHSQYGVANWFVRMVLDNKPIQVFGDGLILRDFLYVDDCVEAILAAATRDAACGEVMNVGMDKPSNFRELAEQIVEIAGCGEWVFAPFTPERKAQEPGDFYSDISKIRRILGWEPQVGLADGLARTIAYYRAYKQYYW
jgi:UDP-glucose 4-epimerase